VRRLRPALEDPTLLGVSFSRPRSQKNRPNSLLAADPPWTIMLFHLGGTSNPRIIPGLSCDRKGLPIMIGLFPESRIIHESLQFLRGVRIATLPSENPCPEPGGWVPARSLSMSVATRVLFLCQRSLQRRAQIPAGDLPVVTPDPGQSAGWRAHLDRTRHILPVAGVIGSALRPHRAPPARPMC